MWQINRRAFIAVLSGRHISDGTLHILLHVDFFLFSHYIHHYHHHHHYFDHSCSARAKCILFLAKSAHFNTLYSLNALYIFPR